MQGLVPEETAAESWEGSEWVNSHLQLKVFWLLVQVPVSLEKHLKWQSSTEFMGLGCWGIKLVQPFCCSSSFEELEWTAYSVARGWVWGVPYHHLRGSFPKGLNTDFFPGRTSGNMCTFIQKCNSGRNSLLLDVVVNGCLHWVGKLGTERKAAVMNSAISINYLLARTQRPA